MIRIADVLPYLPVDRVTGSADRVIPSVTHDSRRVERGGCFVAIQGFTVDGGTFISDAIARGAAVIVAGRKPPEAPGDITWIQVSDTRRALSRLASLIYGNPSRDMDVIGVTGTNGKTTVVSLLHQILRSQDVCARIGTMGMVCSGPEDRDLLRVETGLTTPEASDVFPFLREVRQAGGRYVAMEVSSVSLTLRRVEDIRFTQAIFTNFSGDHLDFHGDMERYLRSKQLLFDSLGESDWAVLNRDDPILPRLLERLNARTLMFGVSDQADIRPQRIHYSLEGIQGNIATPRGILSFKSPLIGQVNLYNILAVVASLTALEIPLDDIRAGLAGAEAVRGRLQRVYAGDFSVIVDYAHTDDALKNLLQSVRNLVDGRIILVFGAGGSRDSQKRPRMGEVASRYADVVILTSDNPRMENPEDILEDIQRGFVKGFDRFFRESDRERAIAMAIGEAQPGDLVVVAGKGHEDYQIFRDKTIHFDDIEVIQSQLTAGGLQPDESLPQGNNRRGRNG